MDFIQAGVRLNKLWGFLPEKWASGELLPQTKGSQKSLNHLQYLHVLKTSDRVTSKQTISACEFNGYKETKNKKK